MTPLPHPQAILFDWDNTLVDTWSIIHAALNMTMRYMDHPEWSIEKVRAEVKQSMRDSFPALFGDRWKEAAEHYQTSYRSIHLKHLHELPGAQQLLEQLKAKNIVLGVVSNKKGESLRKEIDFLKWNHFFDVAIGAGDAARDKPHADPAFMALDKLQITPGPSVWFVGDTSVDIDCAKAAGLTPIFYAEHDPAEDADPAIAAHVQNYNAFLRLISA